MSARDRLLEIIRRMPESASPDELVRAISDHLIAMKADWDAEDVTEEEWRLFAAQGLAADLADPREDIYTLSDGVALHESR